MIRSTGTLKYSREDDGRYKLIVEVDEGIVRLARTLLPPVIRTRLNPQRYAPHITVVRNEVPMNPMYWGDREGMCLDFRYNPEVVVGETYSWLVALSRPLIAIRTKLGLPPSTEWTRPPDDTESFHITIGNFKNG